MRQYAFSSRLSRYILPAKWSDIDFNEKQLLVKTGTKRVVLSDIAVRILEEAYDPRGAYIVPGATFDKPRVNINLAWTRLTRSPGMNARICDVRHSFASLVANSDASTLKDLLHHASRAAGPNAHRAMRGASARAPR